MMKMNYFPPNFMESLSPVMRNSQVDAADIDFVFIIGRDPDITEGIIYAHIAKILTDFSPAFALID